MTWNKQNPRFKRPNSQTRPRPSRKSARRKSSPGWLTRLRQQISAFWSDIKPPSSQEKTPSPAGKILPTGPGRPIRTTLPLEHFGLEPTHENEDELADFSQIKENNQPFKETGQNNSDRLVYDENDCQGYLFLDEPSLSEDEIGGDQPNDWVDPEKEGPSQTIELKTVVKPGVGLDSEKKYDFVDEVYEKTDASAPSADDADDGFSISDQPFASEDGFYGYESETKPDEAIIETDGRFASITHADDDFELENNLTASMASPKDTDDDDEEDNGESRFSDEESPQCRPSLARRPRVKKGFTGWLRLGVLTAAGLFVIGGGYFLLGKLFNDSAPDPAVGENITPSQSVLPEVKTPPPGIYELYGLRQTEPLSDEMVISAGSTLSQTFERLGLGARGEGAAIIAFLNEKKALGTVRPGAKVKIYWHDPQKKSLRRVEYLPASSVRPLVILPKEGGYWHFSQASEPVSVSQAREGIVENSLWGAGVQAGLDHNLIMTMTEIMASEIDFLADVKTGDTFQILYNREYADGRPIGPPAIEMVRMATGSRNIEFYRYINGDRESGYYDAFGRSNKKTFFLSPLQYKRISSGYNLKRMHPIHKVVKPHQGVDYAAPSGTPVSTVADGVVTFVGWNSGYGRQVVVKHDSAYATMYSHLSRFEKDLSKGTKVKQGDVVAYVGATGTATGPHLDFRMKKDGVFVDPLPEIAKQQGRPLEAADGQAFAQLVTLTRNRLNELLLAQK